ncbi:phosphotransferase family protein [Kaistia dalseonensis]|uniref:Thiamine kinase-like enzyme n=1 Tax=Kaistia dalseonensis TaxID=410840 RepID=A0ABU0H5N2_9HYPH|nr:choline/ethanolamine kinase family protein [Kaistia dalseonensis]MCX5495033.1 phosphotransferase family protein [Kaistia dalseonensis]MDQ0437615.1 thiamine kinase-like enzyme [Kaistia dalseonensis]
MSDHRDPRALAASLAFWSRPVDPQPLPGGLTNTNFVVEDQGRKFVVRIGGDIPVHGIVRANELAASQAAASAGVSPIVAYAEPGALVMDFIEGSTFTPEDIRDPRNLPRLVQLVRRAHRDIPRFFRGPAPMFWAFQVIRDYTHQLEDDESHYLPMLVDLLDAADRLEVAVGPIELVFGHNDLLAANFIDDGTRLWLVDWDYAGFNSPLFDLGGLASNSALGEDARDRLLELYFERPVTDELRRKSAAMTAASLLREAMWSMVSEMHSPLNFNYEAYTHEYLTRFKAALALFDVMERT